MYSVLSALTWRPMPAAAHSRLCSRVSAWAGVFARSAMSSAWSASIIVCAGYLLLLSFVNLKPLSFILSTDVRSTLSRQIIERYGELRILVNYFILVINCVLVKNFEFYFISTSWHWKSQVGGPWVYSHISLYHYKGLF